MSFLASLFADFFMMLAKAFVGDLEDYLKKKKEQEQIQRSNQEAADASVAPLIKAKTGQEIDDATKDALDKT